MHGAAHAAVEAIGFHEYLCQQAKQQKILREVRDGRDWNVSLNGAQQIALLMRFHDAREILRREFGDGGQALGDELAMAPMAAENMVLRRERQRGTNGRALLAERKMGWAFICVCDVLI